MISLLLTLLVGLFILLGSFLGLNYKNSKKLTDFSISIAFGVIISLIIFEILPESFEILNNEIGKSRAIMAIIVLAIIGIVLLKILDLFVPHHSHELHHNHNHQNEECHNEHLHHIGIVSSMGIIFHNLIEGMSIFIVSSSNIFFGIIMCLGVGLHNIPMGFVIASTLSNTNYSKKKVLKVSLIVSLATFLGGLVMFIFGGVSELTEGIMLGLTLGMLVYISIFELAHQIYHMKNKKIAYIGISIGIVLMLLSSLLEYIIH